MAGINVEIVTPTRVVFRGVADEVRAPGFTGEFGVLPGHTPFLSVVVPGVVTLSTAGQDQRYVVGKGFVEAGPDRVAVSGAGLVPFAMMAAKDGSFGYEMEIIVPAGSPIQAPADLKGKTLAFTSPTSNSGFKAPSAILKSSFGMEADKDFKTTFSGKHDNSILGVANNDYEAAAVANSVLKRMVRRNAVDPSKIRTVYKSQTFPTTGYGHAHNLHPAVAAKIKQAFFTFPWEGSELQKEFKKEGRFVSIHHKSDWAVIRQIDAANGVKYECK